MEKSVAKYITRAIVLSGLFSMISSVMIMTIVIYLNSQPVQEKPRMNCFPGLGYGIAIGFNLFYMLASCSAYLNVFSFVKNNISLSILSFFSLLIIFEYLVFFTDGGISGSEVFFIASIFLLYFVPWTWFFVSFRKKFINQNN